MIDRKLGILLSLCGVLVCLIIFAATEIGVRGHAVWNGSVDSTVIEQMVRDGNHLGTYAGTYVVENKLPIPKRVSPPSFSACWGNTTTMHGRDVGADHIKVHGDLERPPGGPDYLSAPARDTKRYTLLFDAKWRSNTFRFDDTGPDNITIIDGDDCDSASEAVAVLPVRDTGTARSSAAHGGITYNVSTSDKRIAYWCGKVNQHREGGEWKTDPDGESGCRVGKLEYCNRWYPDTVRVEEEGKERIEGWRRAGNYGYYTATKMTYRCVTE